MDKFRSAVRRLSEEVDLEKGKGKGKDSLIENDELKNGRRDEDHRVLGPLSALLGDVCRLTGFSYAEVLGSCECDHALRIALVVRDIASRLRLHGLTI
jgi:hypothetical protein